MGARHAPTRARPQDATNKRRRSSSGGRNTDTAAKRPARSGSEATAKTPGATPGDDPAWADVAAAHGWSCVEDAVAHRLSVKGRADPKAVRDALGAYIKALRAAAVEALAQRDAAVEARDAATVQGETAAARLVEADAAAAVAASDAAALKADLDDAAQRGDAAAARAVDAQAVAADAVARAEALAEALVAETARAGAAEARAAEARASASAAVQAAHADASAAAAAADAALADARERGVRQGRRRRRGRPRRRGRVLGRLAQATERDPGLGACRRGRARRRRTSVARGPRRRFSPPPRRRGGGRRRRFPRGRRPGCGGRGRSARGGRRGRGRRRARRRARLLGRRARRRGRRARRSRRHTRRAGGRARARRRWGRARGGRRGRDRRGRHRRRATSASSADAAALQARVRTLEADLATAAVRERALRQALLDAKGAIRVVARVRPPTPAEVADAPLALTQAAGGDGDTKLTLAGPAGGHAFAFDRVFGAAASNADVFAELDHAVRSVVDGCTVCVAPTARRGRARPTRCSAAGAPTRGWCSARSGRCLTAWTKCRSRGGSALSRPIRRGVQRRPGRLAGGARKRGRHRRGRPRPPTKLAVAHGDDGATTIVGAAVHPLQTAAAASALAARGARAPRRRDGLQRGLVPVARSLFHHSEGKLHAHGRGRGRLVGPGRPRGVGAAQGFGRGRRRAREAAAINKSLSALGDAIVALGDDGRTHVPVRNAKLTWALARFLARAHASHSCWLPRPRRPPPGRRCAPCGLGPK